MTTTYAELLLHTIIDTYIDIMGSAAWEAKTRQEQHDIIMTMVKDVNKALDNLSK